MNKSKLNVHLRKKVFCMQEDFLFSSLESSEVSKKEKGSIQFRMANVGQTYSNKN